MTYWHFHGTFDNIDIGFILQKATKAIFWIFKVVPLIHKVMFTASNNQCHFQQNATHPSL